MVKLLSADKKNLLLCFDAFGTLFTPKIPIPEAYAKAAARHGVVCGDDDNKSSQAVGAAFKLAFKKQTKINPNYGQATDLGSKKWWGNVIRDTFQKFLKPDRQAPSELVQELIQMYSGKEGYTLYPDVKDVIRQLKRNLPNAGDIFWQRVVIGVITNSDDRVPTILRDLSLTIGRRTFGKPDKRIRNRVDFNANDIDFIVMSYDVGFEKPARQIFDAATDLLGQHLASGKKETLTVDDFRKVYVGDDLEKDYLGATEAGWDAILLNRDADPLTIDEKPADGSRILTKIPTIKSLSQIGLTRDKLCMHLGNDKEIGNEPGNEPGNESGSKTGSKTGNKTGNENGSKVSNETGDKTGKKTGEKTGKKTGKKTGNKLAKNMARNLATELARKLTN